MKVEFLEWDSSFFGWSVGRTQLERSFNPVKLKRLLDRSGCRVVYLFLDEPDEVSVSTIQTIAPLCDLKCVYFKQLKRRNKKAPDHIFPYTGNVTDRLKDLAFISGTYSRFSTDTHFKPYFESLYTEWVRQSVSGSISDIVFVFREEGHLGGFITVAKDTKKSMCTIGLLAVHPDFQGRGIASKLLDMVEVWANGSKIKCIDVVTQGENIPACRLYEKNGYSLCKKTAVFHYWRPVGD